MSLETWRKISYALVRTVLPIQNMLTLTISLVFLLEMTEDLEIFIPVITGVFVFDM